jgi:hypothetical protein
MLIITALMTVSGARLGFKSLGLLNKSLKK